MKKAILLAANILLVCLPASGAREVPVRLDIHVVPCLGVANAWSYTRDILHPSYVLDINGKALVNKSDVKHKIPRKYARFVGEEIYIGHLLVPHTLLFSLNPDIKSFDFLIDWQPLAVSLINIPAKRTNAAPTNFQFMSSLALAYHLLKIDDRYYHSPRPGIDVRAVFRKKIAGNISVKVLVFQKLFIPDFEEIDGKDENIMPNTTGVGLGIVYHHFMKRSI